LPRRHAPIGSSDEAVFAVLRSGQF
jgi:hypothetical protein